MGQVYGKLEEVKKELELIEQDNWNEIEEIVLLVVECIGNCVFGVGVSVQPD